MQGVFVTGTGTGVGKTIVAALIANGLRRAGAGPAVFKPAVTGLEEPGDPDHELLRRAAGSSQGDDEIAPYRYRPPVSPHLASELAGEEIEPRPLVAAARAAGSRGGPLVCEGVGGLLVPLTSGYLVRDFARDLGLPIVVAASPMLGTINHTLMTLEAARAVGLEAACVALTPWPQRPGRVEESNRSTIADLGDVAVEVVPKVDPGDVDSWPEPPGAALAAAGA